MVIRLRATANDQSARDFESYTERAEEISFDLFRPITSPFVRGGIIRNSATFEFVDKRGACRGGKRDEGRRKKKGGKRDRKEGGWKDVIMGRRWKLNEGCANNE